MEIGTTNAVVTDMDGKYSIDIEGVTVLRYTYPGCEEENRNARPGMTIDVALIENDYVYSSIFSIIEESRLGKESLLCFSDFNPLAEVPLLTLQNYQIENNYYEKNRILNFICNCYIWV